MTYLQNQTQVSSSCLTQSRCTDTCLEELTEVCSHDMYHTSILAMHGHIIVFKLPIASSPYPTQLSKQHTKTLKSWVGPGNEASICQ